MDYKSSGVDIDAATASLDRIRALARETFTEDTLSDIGSFGGLFRLNTSRFKHPVLVASTDGVGTKLKIAFATGRHVDVGYDLVSHCINDILVQGALPLFFLDYLAMGRLESEIAAGVVKGMAEACQEFGVSLLGGETAEMPDFYQPGEYDVSGTIVGVVEQDKIIDRANVEPGNVLLGLSSMGLHTNGYSLARKVFFEQEGLSPSDQVPALEGTVADALMARHRCYLPLIEPLLDGGCIKAMAHITGGGLTDNLPRVMPDTCAAHVDLSAWTLPPIFRYLMEKGDVNEAEMLRTFNNGIGMVIFVSKEDEDVVLQATSGFRIGEVKVGNGTVHYTGSLV